MKEMREHMYFIFEYKILSLYRLFASFIFPINMIILTSLKISYFEMKNEYFVF